MSFSKRIVGALSLLFLGIVVALPFFLNEESRPLNQAVREKAPGRFMEGPAGKIHFEIEGPEEGPPVLLVHGVSGPMSVWDKTVPALAEQGFRVIRFDLYGRGYSDRPDLTYDLPLYTRQVNALLNHTVGEREVYLVGSSMGCIIVAALAQEHPERFPRVALVGPAGFPLQATPVASLMKVPYLNSYLMNTVGGKNLKAHNRNYFYQPEKFASYHESYAEQMQYHGYKRSILSTMLHVPVKDFESGYEALGKLEKPLLLVWGKEDKTFPFTFHETALDLMPEAEFLAVPKAGHLPMYEQPEKVHKKLLEFLSAP